MHPQEASTTNGAPIAGSATKLLQAAHGNASAVSAKPCEPKPYQLGQTVPVAKQDPIEAALAVPSTAPQPQASHSTTKAPDVESIAPKAASPEANKQPLAHVQGNNQQQQPTSTAPVQPMDAAPPNTSKTAAKPAPMTGAKSPTPRNQKTAYECFVVAFRKEYKASLSGGEVAYDEKVMRKKAHDNWDLVEPADKLVFQEQADLLKQQKQREELKEKKAEALSKPKPAQRKKKREEDNVQPAKKGKSAMTDFFPVAGGGASTLAPKSPTPYQCFVSRFRDEYKIGAERAGSVFSEKEMRAAAKGAWSEFNDDLKLPFVKESQQLAQEAARAAGAAKPAVSRRPGKKAKSAYEFFVADFRKKYRLTIEEGTYEEKAMRQHAKEAWDVSPDSEKAPYQKMSQDQREACRAAFTDLKNQQETKTHSQNISSEEAKSTQALAHFPTVTKSRFGSGFDLYLDKLRKQHAAAKIGPVNRETAQAQWAELSNEVREQHEANAKKPPPPPPAYQLFLKQFKEESKEMFPEAMPKEVMKAGSECWKELTKEVRSMFEKQASDLREIYTAQCTSAT